MHHEVSFLYHWINELLNHLLGAPPAGKVLFSIKALGFDFKMPDVWMPDHVLNALTVLLVLTAIAVWVRKGLSKDKPSGLQQVFEIVIGGIRGLLFDVIGHHGDHYLPMIASFAFFIFVSNFFGLIFFLQPPTANLNTNLALALVSFAYYHTQGFRHAGPGYLKHFLGPMLVLAPLFILLEPISHIARVVSLTLRLTGNIGGEHTATGVFTGFFPVLLPWPMMLLGMIGAGMQAFIFVMLSSVYVSGAVSEEH